MHKIHCLNNISKVGLSTLPSDYQLTDHLHDAQAILVRSAAMHEIDLPSSILAVARAGAGVNNIPFDRYADEGVVCFNTPGANANAVKELTLAGMLLASRDIYGGMKWIEENRQDSEIAKTVEKAKAQFGGTEIFGKTIGIIGLGAIGMKIALACHALGMQVIGAEKNLDAINKNLYPSNMQFFKDMEDILPHADFISINVPLLPDTKGMINEEAFKKMKQDVVILNFARDALVNDDDLEKAIASKKVRCYVTDFPNPKTVNMEKVIAIPHLGASTEEAEDNCAIMAIEQLRKYIEEGSIINSVNYPNLLIKHPIEFMRLQVLMRLNEKDIESCVQSIKQLSQNYTHINYAARKNLGYMVIDFNQKIDDHIIEDIMKLPCVLRVINIQK